MKVALVCCGLEHIQRGFESFSRELFDNFEDTDIEVHLYKGSGKRERNELVIPCIPRNSFLLNIFKATPKGIYYKYKIECYSFAFMMLPYLIKRKYDIIHCSDNELGKALLKFRKLFRLHYKILFSNGAPWHAGECKIYDGVQEVTNAMQQKNIRDGVKKEVSWYVPYGIAVNKYAVHNDLSINAIRENYKIPVNAFVILSLSALKMTHKRLDWLIKEYSKLGEGFFLVMAGAEDEETKSVKEMASVHLRPGSYIFLTVPHQEVVKLLAASDVMVSTSLSEAFGRVLAEATAAKIPVLSHPHDAAIEIIAHELSFVDMEKPGELADRLKTINENEPLRENMVDKNYSYCLNTFDWSLLNLKYSSMYKSVLYKDK